MKYQVIGDVTILCRVDFNDIIEAPTEAKAIAKAKAQILNEDWSWQVEVVDEGDLRAFEEEEWEDD